MNGFQRTLGIRALRRAAVAALAPTALAGSVLAGSAPAAGASTAPPVGSAAAAEVFPTPQSATRLPGSVVLPQQVDVVAGSAADPAALALTRSVLASHGVTVSLKPSDGARPGSTVITVGTSDTATRSALADLGVKGADGLPAEGYVLAAGVGAGGTKRIVLAGADPTGTYYAAQSLRQLIRMDAARPRVDGVSIRDWPGYAIRGGMESFYGPVWSQEDRRAQIEFLAAHKMNQFFYGPANDPRTGSDWSSPYGADELGRLAEIVELARERHIDVVYRVSPEAPLAPSKGICHARPGDVDKLVARFEQLWGIGIRSYTIAWDDVNGRFACAEDEAAFGHDAAPLAAAQAHVTNRVQEAFIAAHPGASRMTTVPTEYWGTEASTYRSRFDFLLSTAVDIYWTGPQVVSRSITGSDLDLALAAFPRHRLMLWDNYPVNDYASNRLLLGPAVNRAPGLESKVLGISFNEMVEQAPSQIALGTQAALAWNPTAYDAERSWARVLRELGGDAATDLRLFAESNRASVLDPTEPPEVTRLVDTLLADYSRGADVTRTAAQLDAYLTRFEQLPARLRASLDDPLMLAQIQPWLERLGRYGTAGRAALGILRAQAVGDGETAWRARRAQAEARGILDRTPQQVAPGPLERLLDFAATQSDGFIGDRWFGDTGTPTGAPPAAAGSSLGRINDRRDDTAYIAQGAPQAGDSITIPLTATHTLSSVTVVQDADSPARATVQARGADGRWVDLGRLEQGHTSVPAAGISATAIRLVFASGGPAPRIYEVVPHYGDVLAGAVQLSPKGGLVAAGDVKRVTLTVVAQDPGTLSGSVSVDSPAGWAVAPTSQRLRFKANGRTVTTSLVADVTVPADAAGGDHHLTARVTTDSGASVEVPMTFTVARRPAGSYPELVVAAGAAGYWRLGDPVGSRAADSSPAGQPGTYLDGATPGAAGAIPGDTAADLGAGYVDVPRTPAADVTGPFTLEGWVRLDSIAPSPGQAVIESYSAPARNGFVLRITDGRLQAWSMSATGFGLVNGRATLTAGQWHHVAAVFDGTSLRVYLDGILDAAAATTVAPGTGTASIKLGGRGDDAGQRLMGELDEVAIYPSALTPDEIAGHVLAARRP